MTRFYFDIDDGARSTIDRIGTDLPDRQAVRDEAIGVLPDIARDQLPDGDDHVFVCSVRDEAGTVIYRATLSLKAGWVDG